MTFTIKQIKQRTHLISSIAVDFFKSIQKITESSVQNRKSIRSQKSGFFLTCESIKDPPHENQRIRHTNPPNPPHIYMFLNK